MTIYLDIVFVENIIMNYIILFATGVICKEKIRQIRIIISSIIGSIYSVAYYITEITLYVTIIAKILLSIVMIYVAFNSKNLKKTFTRQKDSDRIYFNYPVKEQKRDRIFNDRQT